VLHEDRTRAVAFGSDAQRYDRARPGYPKALIDRLVDNQPEQVVDVGCGTGLAARALIARGVSVIGVEPDVRMAEVAQAAGVAVEVGTFEGWNPGGREYDLVTCAQAWHWVDPTLGTAKAAEVLRPDGRAAVFWNVGRMDSETAGHVDRVYAAIAPGLDEYSIVLGRGGFDRPEAAAETFRGHGAWHDVRVEHFPHAVRYSTEEWLDHLLTHPDHGRLSAERRGRLFDALAVVIEKLGGYVTMEYDAVVVLASRG
jgi:SAM-dependent methyltransferase